MTAMPRVLQVSFIRDSSDMRPRGEMQLPKQLNTSRMQNASQTYQIVVQTMVKNLQLIGMFTQYPNAIRIDATILTWGMGLFI